MPRSSGASRGASGARAVADIALFTAYTEENRHICPDIGANRILLEGKYLYNIIDRDCDFSAYKLIVFPDTVRFDSDLAARCGSTLRAAGVSCCPARAGA